MRLHVVMSRDGMEGIGAICQGAGAISRLCRSSLVPGEIRKLRNVHLDLPKESNCCPFQTLLDCQFFDHLCSNVHLGICI